MYKRLIFLSILFSATLVAEIYPFETPTVKYLKSIHIEEFDSGLEMIDCIYVINLDERTQRWEKMQTLFKENGLHPNRVPAVNGWKLSEDIKKELLGPYDRNFIGGHVGAFLSHVSILKDAFERGWNVIWVCEDDIEFAEDVRQFTSLLKSLNEIDSNWDVFYTDIDMRVEGGYHFHSLATDFRPDEHHFPLEYYMRRILRSNDIMEIGQRYGMHSLMFSRNGIKKVLNYYTHVYLWTHIDIDLHHIPNIRQYSVTRDIVTNSVDHIVSDTSSDPNK